MSAGICNRETVNIRKYKTHRLSVCVFLLYTGGKFTMKYDYILTGERLRQRRTELKLTREKVAEEIDRSTKYYADIERGSCSMSIKTLINISNTLHLSLDYIIFGTDSVQS